MSANENHLFPSRFVPTPENVATAIEYARRSTPELKWGGVELTPGEVEQLLAKGTGKVWMAWAGPADGALYAAVTGNGPTSEVNALFFAHARDVVIALGEEVQRLRLVADAAISVVADAMSDATSGETLVDRKLMAALEKSVEALEVTC